MKRLFALLMLGVLGLVGLTACMGDDDNGSAREQRRAAALVQAGGGSSMSSAELTIAGITPAGKAISVESYSWGVTNNSTVGGTSGATAGKPVFRNLEITKKLDEMSPLLFKAASAVTSYPSAVLTLYTAPAGKPAAYATYELTNVIFVGVEQAGQSDAIPSEQISLIASKVKLTSAPRNADGSLGTPLSWSFDLATMKGV